LYDWADLPYRALTAPGWQKGLLIRPKIKKPNEFTFYLTLSPTGNTLGRTGAGGRHALDRRELLRDGQRRGRAGSIRSALVDRLAPPHHPGNAGPRLPCCAAQDRGRERGKNRPPKPISLAFCGWTCYRTPCSNCAGCSGVWSGPARPITSIFLPGRYGGTGTNSALAAAIGNDERVPIKSDCSIRAVLESV
jgi:hypothetical protein